MGLRAFFEEHFGGFYKPPGTTQTGSPAGSHARLTDLHETLVGPETEKPTPPPRSGGGHVVRTSGSHGSEIGTGTKTGGSGITCAPNFD